MAASNHSLSCPDCATECTPWTISGRKYFTECKNPACRRYMITLEVEHWLHLTNDEIASFHTAHTDYDTAAKK
jgi:hypothetical protein